MPMAFFVMLLPKGFDINLCESLNMISFILEIKCLVLPCFWSLKARSCWHLNALKMP